MQSLIGSVRNYIRIRSQHNRSKSRINTGSGLEELKTSTKSSDKSYLEIQDNTIALASINERQFDDIEGQKFGNKEIRFPMELS